MMQDIRDEDGRLLLRFDPEARIIEVIGRHYDNERRKHVKTCRRLLVLPSGPPQLLPPPSPLPVAISLKEKAA